MDIATKKPRQVALRILLVKESFGTLGGLVVPNFSEDGCLRRSQKAGAIASPGYGRFTNGLSSKVYLKDKIKISSRILQIERHNQG